MHVNIGLIMLMIPGKPVKSYTKEFLILFVEHLRDSSLSQRTGVHREKPCMHRESPVIHRQNPGIDRDDPGMQRENPGMQAQGEPRHGQG